MKSKAAGCGSISTVISSIVLLCVSLTTTTTIIIKIIITIIKIIVAIQDKFTLTKFSLRIKFHKELRVSFL